MYVCICNAVRESDVRHAVEQGVCSFRDAVHQLNMANRCGKCARHAHALFTQARAARDAEGQGKKEPDPDWQQC